MAKKNLHSLMSGIIGTDSPSPEPEQGKNSGNDTPKEVKAGPGRPKSAGGTDEVRATFIVSDESLRKLKYIALMESRLQKDIVGDALTRYISDWEAENGRIRMPKKI